jgi:hypothetical protein
MKQTNRDLATDFEFSLIDDFGGYVSSKDKTNVEEYMFVRGSYNVYKKLSGTISARPGMLRKGAADATAAKVDSEYVWNTSWGAVLPVWVSNSKLQVEFNDVWYDIATSLTKTRYVFDAWWDDTAKKDKLLFVNGTSSLFSWSGGVCAVASGTANTITKLDTTKTWQQEGFSQTGSILIDGTTYAYTGGYDTTTLTGVTGDASGLTSGKVAVQTIETEADKPSADFNSDFLKVVNNQVYVGSYTSRVIYISSNTDFTDYTVPATRVAGSPELLTLDATAKGICVRQGNAHIGAGTNYWYVVSFTDVTVGTTLTQSTTVDRKPVSTLSAPLAHEFIDVVGDTIVYLSQDQQVRTFGDYRNLFTPAYPALSQQIFDELQEEDFTGGQLKSIGDFTYITAPNTGKVYLYQVRQSVDKTGNVVSERLWHAPFIWNITRIDEINGVVYGFSNANPQLYQLWNTGQWRDDSPSGEYLPYTCVLAMAYRNHDRRQGLISFDKVYTEGYISQGTNLNLKVRYNYQGSLTTLNAVINNVDQPTTFQSGSSPFSIGDGSIGDKILGDGLIEGDSDQELLPKFRNISSMALENVFEYQVMIYSDEIDSRWEILALGTNAGIEEQQQATFIINKK